jgi:hypothetical protein
LKPGSILLVALAALLAACGTAADRPAPPTSSAPVRSGIPSASAEAPSGEPPPPSTGSVVKVADGAPLPDGLVTFEGMVTPTKGGFDVRGVTLDGGTFPQKLAASSPDAPRDPDGFLGAVVRVTAELRRHDDGPPDPPGGIAIQRRSGPHVQVVRLEAIEWVKPPVMIEGKLQRSKGLMQLGEHLVTRRDLAWALAPDGAEDGDRVRLWGQPRVYRCAPNEQCLMEGSIPMFDVGRAARLP